MSRLLLLELAVAATILGLMVAFFESAEPDCSGRGGVNVMTFPIGIACVAKL